MGNSLSGDEHVGDDGSSSPSNAYEDFVVICDACMGSVDSTSGTACTCAQDSKVFGERRRTYSDSGVSSNYESDEAESERDEKTGSNLQKKDKESSDAESSDSHDLLSEDDDSESDPFHSEWTQGSSSDGYDTPGGYDDATKTYACTSDERTAAGANINNGVCDRHAAQEPVPPANSKGAPRTRPRRLSSNSSPLVRFKLKGSPLARISNSPILRLSGAPAQRQRQSHSYYQRMKLRPQYNGLSEGNRFITDGDL